MGKFIQIRSTKFPILPGEVDELMNEGLYGKALAIYLQEELTKRAYTAPFICCEDWGWWVELKGAPFSFGVCIYSVTVSNGPPEFICADGAIGRRRWSWGRLSFVDTRAWIDKLSSDLYEIFSTDEEVEIVCAQEDDQT